MQLVATRSHRHTPGVKPLEARRHYPTLRIEPYRRTHGPSHRRSPLSRLQWIFGFSLISRPEPRPELR